MGLYGILIPSRTIAGSRWPTKKSIRYIFLNIFGALALLSLNRTTSDGVKRYVAAKEKAVGRQSKVPKMRISSQAGSWRSSPTGNTLTRDRHIIQPHI